MKARIEVMLSMWGRWALKRESGALGYPSVSPMFKDSPRGDGYGSGVPLGYSDDDMDAVDRAVRRLPRFHYEAVVQVYQRGGSMRAVAGRLGCDHKTLTRYINEAHEKIAVDIDSSIPQNTPQFDSVCNCVQEKPAAER